MSSEYFEAIEILTKVIRATDGAIVGLALAYLAVRTWSSYNSTSSALQKIRRAPLVGISDLRSLLSSSSSTKESSNENLVVIRGLVEAKSTVVNGNWDLEPDVLLSCSSGEKAVLLQRTQTCILSNEKQDLMGWILARTVFGRSWKDLKVSPLRMVPFVLVEIGQSPRSDYVIVNLNGSKHPLPLATVYRNLQRVPDSIYKIIDSFFGHAYPVSLLDEEKVLSLGKEISAVGICSLQDGIPQIESCQDLPCFLSKMTKDQMVDDLAFKTDYLFWGSLLLGSLSLGILGYAVMRNWRRWKEWWQQRQIQRSGDAGVATEYQSDEETGVIPDGESCVICLTRRSRFAFLPCGHLASCRGCAISVEQVSEPKCPVCRQTVTTSHRIYVS